MRRPPYHRDDRGRMDVKMTPMIDVIFLLLIFFVCTASFQPPEEILPTSLSLPGTIDSQIRVEPELEDLDEVVVKVFLEGGDAYCRVNQQEPRSLEEDRAVEEVRAVLVAIARRVKPDVPVILDVAGDVPMEDVIDVYDLCRQAGLEKIRFAASAQTMAAAEVP